MLNNIDGALIDQYWKILNNIGGALIDQYWKILNSIDGALIIDQYWTILMDTLIDRSCLVLTSGNVASMASPPLI